LRLLTSSILIVPLFIVPLFISEGRAQPSLPAGFDLGGNSMRGGEIGESVTLQITPYNAGKKLFESELFSVYERINLLSSDHKTYGDPICAISKPGEQYEYYRTNMVVVMNLERDKPISRRLLWDEVRPVLSKLSLELCPQASGVNAHVFTKGWDVTGTGQVFMPEAIPLPRVKLRELTESDVATPYNFRNNRAVETINAIVSEGILSAYFAFPRGANHNCGNSGKTGQGCSFETFAPVYWGAPDRMLAFSLTGRSLSAGMASQREAMRRRRNQVLEEYEQRYTTFNGFEQGVAYRVVRDEKVRRRKESHAKAMEAYYKALSEAMDLIEKQGIGPSIFKRIAGSGGSSNRTLCSARANSLMDSCTEDFLFLVY